MTTTTVDSFVMETLLADSATYKVDSLVLEALLADNGTYKVDSLVMEVLSAQYIPLKPFGDRHRRIR